MPCFRQNSLMLLNRNCTPSFSNTITRFGLAAAAFSWRTPAASAPGPFVAVADEGGSILDAVYAPTGRWLAVVSDRTGDFEITLRDLAAGTSRPLTADGMRNVHLPVYDREPPTVSQLQMLMLKMKRLLLGGEVLAKVVPGDRRPSLA